MSPKQAYLAEVARYTQDLLSQVLTPAEMLKRVQHTNGAAEHITMTIIGLCGQKVTEHQAVTGSELELHSCRRSGRALVVALNEGSDKEVCKHLADLISIYNKVLYRPK